MSKRATRPRPAKSGRPPSNPRGIRYAPELARAIRQGKFLAEETERGVILVAAAMFDSQLEETLLSFLADCKTATELLGVRGALGTFAARTKACYALGLITLNEKQWLELIEELRNLCAHRWDLNDFAAVLAAVPLKRRTEHGERLAAVETELADSPADERGPSGTRVRFERIVASLMVNMLYRPSKVAPEKRAIRQLTDWDSTPEEKAPPERG